MKNRIQIVIVSVLLSLGSLKAQEAANSAGCDAVGTGGSSSYTLGIMAYTSVKGTGGTSSQGVQQGHELSVVTGKDFKNIVLGMSAYPNPTTDNLRLTVADANDLSYQLYDLQGNKIKSTIISEEITEITLADHPDAVYLLKVLQSNELLKTFKIIKH